jgi:hypothetical protein
VASYVLPIAVDFDTSGNPLYAYSGYYYNSNFNTGIANIYYVGTGDATCTYVSDISGQTIVGRYGATDDLDFLPATFNCLDVRANAWCITGTHCYYEYEEPHSLDPPSVQNPNYVCWPFSSGLSHGVACFLGGNMLDLTFYPCPDGALITQQPPCPYTAGDSAFAPLMNADCVQPYYAARFDQYVISYNVSPAPAIALYFPEPISGTNPECGCMPSWIDVSTEGGLDHMTLSQLSPRGGKVLASFTLPTEMGWSFYARVV